MAAMAMKLTLFCVAAVILPCQGNVTPDIAAAANQGRFGRFNRYYVYTRSNFRNPVPVLATNDSIQASPIVEADNTVIIAHGAGASAFTSLNNPLRDAYMRLGGYNVIVIDWSVFANQGYATAAAAVPDVGAGLGEFIALLRDNKKVKYASLHLVGFGLGAHVMGFAGRDAGGIVARITGLDPAGAGWGPDSLRLRPSDAAYVEVIHTDGFTTTANGIGAAIGHVDFFANRGRSHQPGCTNNACSHNRAWELFVASIESNKHLVGSYCNTLALMTANTCTGPTEYMGGNELQKYASGIYSVRTGSVYPFNV